MLEHNPSTQDEVLMPKIGGMTVPFVATMIVLLLVSSAVLGQQKTFPINKEMVEPDIIACPKEEEAVAIAETMAKWNMDMSIVNPVVVHQIRNRKCVRLLKVPITYSRMVYESPTGNKIRVYQGTVGLYQVFVPMQGFEHEAT